MSFISEDTREQREVKDYWDLALNSAESQCSGLPVGVQLVCAPYCDAVCAHVAQAIAMASPSPPSSSSA